MPNALRLEFPEDPPCLRLAQPCVRGRSRSRIKEFLLSRQDPATTEYAVTLAVIIVVAIGTILTFGSTVKKAR